MIACFDDTLGANVAFLFPPPVKQSEFKLMFAKICTIGSSHLRREVNKVQQEVAYVYTQYRYLFH